MKARLLLAMLLSGGLLMCGRLDVRAQDGHTSPAMRLVVNGRAVPVRLIKGTAEMILPLSALCAELKAQLSVDRKQANVVNLTRALYRVQLLVGNRRILYRAVSTRESREKPYTLSLLPEPVQRRHGELYVPVSVAGYLGASVTVDRAAGEVRIETAVPDGPDVWMRDLGVPKTAVFAQKTFAISRLKIAFSGKTPRVGAEGVVNLTLTAPGYVQIYQVEDGKAQPLLGQQDGRLVYFPLALGIRPAPVPVQDRLRMPVQITQPGPIYLIAVATTEAVDVDLREALQQGPVRGRWAINAVRIEEIDP